MTEVIVRQPPHDGVTMVLKQLAKARKLEQFAGRTDAIDLVIATIRKITDGRTFSEPCELRACINAAAKRNKNFRAALDLVEFER